MSYQSHRPLLRVTVKEVAVVTNIEGTQWEVTLEGEEHDTVVNDMEWGAGLIEFKHDPKYQVGQTLWLWLSDRKPEMPAAIR